MKPTKLDAEVACLEPNVCFWERTVTDHDRKQVNQNDIRVWSNPYNNFYLVCCRSCKLIKTNWKVGYSMRVPCIVIWIEIKGGILVAKRQSRNVHLCWPGMVLLHSLDLRIRLASSSRCKLFSVSSRFICENRIPQFGRATHLRLLMQLVGTSDITKPFILLWVYCQCSALCVTFFEGESLTIDFDGLLHPFITQAGRKSCRRYFCQRWYDIYIAEALMLIRRMYVKNFDLNLSKIVTAISYIININRSNFIVGSACISWVT